MIRRATAIMTAFAVFSSMALPVHAQEFPATTDLPAEIINPDMTTPLSGADAADVREAVTRVYLAEDARDRAALEAVVTEDFVQEHAIYGETRGARAFADFVINAPQAFDRYRHMAMNVVTRGTGPDSAEALSYILVLNLHPADEAAAAALPSILAHGVVRDRLVRLEDGWRISHRIYDQFAVSAGVVPDRDVRLNASRSIASDEE